jgi:hypothetical protein
MVEKMNMSDLLQELKSPPSSYRSLPFWGWNDRLDKKELLRQIDIMREVGIGGFFMHSRDGLETTYLGKNWDDCIRACAFRAKKLGMEAWLYDEDRWPSGSCGGKVQKIVGSLKGLTLEVIRNPDISMHDKNLTALYAARIDGEKIFTCRRLSPERAGQLEPDETLLVVRLEGSAASAWFNGNPPPDNLNPESVKTFIRLTHEHYRQLFGSRFPALIKGSFSDEESLCDRHASFDPHRGWIPWTTGFGDWIKQKTGYDILDYIPYFYFNGEYSAKVRFDYWHMIALRFEECYSGQIGQWCDARHIAYTGHFLQEDKMGLCCRVNGSIMPHYIHQMAPGIDMLCEQTDEYLTVKQCTSVANQLNKKDVVTETYAATGWEFSFEGQKWIGDWQYVLGVNRRCQHLALYSIRGCRKRDYPPCFNYNTTWWNKIKVVEDYFARLSVIMHKGKPVRDVLILHPMSHVWASLGCSPYGNPVRNEEAGIRVMDAYGNDFNNFLKLFCENHIDFDLGDETIIQRFGSVLNGKFTIDSAAYSVVVVPSMLTVFASTLDLLEKFQESGGTIITLLPYPVLLEGKTDPAPEVFFSKCIPVSDIKELPGLVCHAAHPVVSVRENDTECPAILVQVRVDGDRRYIFIVNNDREHCHELSISSFFSGKLDSLDLLTGNIHECTVSSADNDGMKWKTHIGPCGSLLYIVCVTEVPCVRIPEKMIYRELLRFSDVWECKTDRPDILPLDICTWALGSGTESEPVEVWKAQKQIREKLHMRPTDTDETEQRYTWIQQFSDAGGTRVSLHFSFTIEEDIRQSLSLVIENSVQYKIYLDNSPVKNKPRGYYLDKSFDMVPLGKIPAGRHSVTLNIDYLETTELENIYIAGNFCVTPDRKLIRMHSVFRQGDWTTQGLLHYPGNLTYCQSFQLEKTEEKLFLDTGEFSGTCVQVCLNGHCFDIPWKANRRTEITEFCRTGKNKLEIEVFGSPRNMMGPFHLSGKRPAFCNGKCFMPDESNFDPEYHVVPYGLLGDTLIYKECIPDI